MRERPDEVCLAFEIIDIYRTGVFQHADIFQRGIADPDDLEHRTQDGPALRIVGHFINNG
ncbi:hypothetical protein D3C87_2115040 [compost metagenome]